MKKCILIVFLFSCFIEINYAQNVNQSLEDSISKYLFNKPEKTINYTKDYIKYNIKQNNQEEILMGYGSLTMAFYNMNLLDSIVFYEKEALKYCKTNMERFMFKIDLANVYQEYGHNLEALQEYEECLELVLKFKLGKGNFEEVNDEINFLRYKIYEPKETTLDVRLKNYDKAVKANDIRDIRYKRLHLITSYLEYNKPDSIFSLVKDGLKDAKSRNNLKFQYLFYKMESEAYILKKDYISASKSIEEAKKILKIFKHKKYAVEINYLQAVIYEARGDYKQQVYTLKHILKQDLNYKVEELSKYYEILANGYLKLGNTEEYAIYNEKYKELRNKEIEQDFKTLTTSHSIVEGIKEREAKQEKEKAKIEKSEKQKWILAFLIACSTLLILFMRNRSIQKKNKKRFNNLIHKIKAYEKEDVNDKPIVTIKKTVEEETINSIENAKDSSEETTFLINDKKINEILKGLKSLEEKHYFLKQDCTLHNTAKKLKTNTSYLSKVVNAHLGKNFSTYINELRINYIIIELKQNKRFRAYTIKAIAEEIGYKKPGAFSKYFKEATGISPSVYIKNLRES